MPRRAGRRPSSRGRAPPNEAALTLLIRLALTDGGALAQTQLTVLRTWERGLFPAVSVFTYAAVYAPEHLNSGISKDRQLRERVRNPNCVKRSRS
jgi:hypothetical protein